MRVSDDNATYISGLNSQRRQGIERRFLLRQVAPLIFGHDIRSTGAYVNDHGPRAAPDQPHYKWHIDTLATPGQVLL